MKRCLLIIFVLFMIPSLALAQDRLAQDEILRISESVVQVVALAPNGNPISSGSGTIIDPSGYIFTNVHVIEGAADYAILMVEDLVELPVLRYFASPVIEFPEIDFAMLQIDRDSNGRAVNSSTLNLPFIALSEQTVGLGEPISIFGFPSIGDGFMVLTNGTITTIQNESIRGQRLPTYYQTDAEISPGNSGGLAVNRQGEFIGIPTFVRSEERTGGRLGGIVSLSAIRVALEMNTSTPQTTTAETLPEVETQPTPVPDYTRLDYRLAANYGGIQINAGFREDPHVLEMHSGATPNGFVDITSLQIDTECRGFSTPSPDYKVLWTGQSQGFRIMFYSDDRTTSGDTVLIVNLPDGSWRCVDDSFNTTNPTVDILNPAEGQYDIWVASYDPRENVHGYLVVTEIAAIDPTTFPSLLQEMLRNQ